MKKQDLKNLIKPLIKECLKEVLIEEGFTKMLSESVSIKQNVEPSSFIKEIKQENIENKKVNLLEAKKKMLDEIGMTGFDAFSGTTPLMEGGNASAPSVPVTSFNASDPGVDISRLMSGKLKATFSALNGKKVKE